MSLESEIIEEVLIGIIEGRPGEAATIIRKRYPFVSPVASGRKYTPLQMMKVFLRDGFIDRYSGRRLIFPPALRFISEILPKDFPYHRNWKMSECHIAYWELFPTIDHVVPAARGGEDADANWVTTSMLRNSAKANWTLEELGWKLFPKGDGQEWDGLTARFLGYVETHPELLTSRFIKAWCAAGRKATRQFSG